MKMAQSIERLQQRIRHLEDRLSESEQLIEAIRLGEIDAFAINSNDNTEVYTLQSGDYAYRMLIEEFGEGAVNVSEDRLIVYSNQGMGDILKMPYEKIVGVKFCDFVHPDSGPAFMQLFNDALAGKKSRGEIDMFSNGEKIPVFLSCVALPKLGTVGIIITDFREKKKNEELLLNYQDELEKKNADLVQSNTELASFAYIASHDLQEPLRKIQTFSNRIIEKEPEAFSNYTKDYFTRIVSASKRMQNLISELLIYSRINTNKTNLVQADLNEILTEIRGDLLEYIEENQAEIIIGKMPKIPVVTHQFNQLFTNLIMNGIKFRKPDVPPKIEVSARKLKKEELDPTTHNGLPTWWRFSVKDNGIGFEQQYGEKIFELFQRLHGLSEYKGTGIGLAICKKIVHNHRGFISAIGHPGLGAEFIIDIPGA